MPSSTFRSLDVIVIGAGLSGISAAIALRREGHRVKIFDKRDVALEVGNSISLAKNGGMWVDYWGVDIQKGLPIDLQQLVMRDYKTGAVDMLYDLSDYAKKWGHPYWMLHRQDMHKMLLDAAVSEEGAGTPCTLQTGYGCDDIDFINNTVTFSNGETATADLIIGADGVVSRVRKLMGMEPKIEPATSTCYRCNVYKSQLKDLNLESMADPAIQFWGGFETRDINKYNKIVMAPCNGGQIISFYCFFPAEQAKTSKEGFFVDDIPLEDLLAPYIELDKACLAMLNVSVDRKPWRLYNHAPLVGWTKKNVGLLGDACHSMFPHQSQGACQGIEDAAALGLVFSAKYGYTQNVEEGLKLYQEVRKARADRVALCSRLATEDIRERIGFSSLPGSASQGAPAPIPGHKRLTVDEVNGYDMFAHIEELVPADWKA